MYRWLLQIAMLFSVAPIFCEDFMPDVKLNLGAGAVVLDGYTPIDRKSDKEVYPLDYDDGSVDDIYASHVLEHFSHTETVDVLTHWVKKLKPGGRIRIAVPNFEWITKHYLDGEPINSVGYVMGGHVDTNDRHGAIFDREYLTEIMMGAGLQRISSWASDVKDCASLDVSLNLQGFKPTDGAEQYTDTIAILSAPRFGPLLHMRCAFQAFGPLGIRYKVCQGAYWHQVITEQMVEAVDEGAEYVFAVDYDAVFSRDDVRELCRLIRARPDVDAICPVQSKRGSEYALFGILDSDGRAKPREYAAEFEKRLTRIGTGHFGLTIFRAAALKKLTHPWMCAEPNDRGRWDSDHIDADIAFWHKWRKEGMTSYMANQVVIGHLEEMVKWPDKAFKPVYQSHQKYVNSGMPPEVAR